MMSLLRTGVAILATLLLGAPLSAQEERPDAGAASAAVETILSGRDDDASWAALSNALRQSDETGNRPRVVDVAALLRPASSSDDAIDVATTSALATVEEGAAVAVAFLGKMPAPLVAVLMGALSAALVFTVLTRSRRPVETERPVERRPTAVDESDLPLKARRTKRTGFLGAVRRRRAAGEGCLDAARLEARLRARGAT